MYSSQPAFPFCLRNNKKEKNEKKRIIFENDLSERQFVYFWIFSSLLFVKLIVSHVPFPPKRFCFLFYCRLFSEACKMSRFTHEFDEWWDWRENEISITIVSITNLLRNILFANAIYTSHCLYAYDGKKCIVLLCFVLLFLWCDNFHGILHGIQSTVKCYHFN